MAQRGSGIEFEVCCHDAAGSVVQLSVARRSPRDALPMKVSQVMKPMRLGSIAVLVFVDQYGWSVDDAIDFLPRQVERELLES